MPPRPKRHSLPAESGRALTLDSGPDAFDPLGGDGPLLFLGLGPEPAALPDWFPEAGDGAAFVERPETEAALGPEFTAAIPEHFRRLKPEELTPGLFRSRRVLAFRQNMRLAPSFWGPILARHGLALLAPPPARPVVWLPGDEHGLLFRELEAAFTAQGLTARRVPADPAALPALLRDERPLLFFSVNFRGLDAHGEAFHLLDQAGVTVAAWCVDNPFHLLSGIKAGFWTALRLFVTDRWFLEPLRRLGAGHVEHLPLALDPAFAAPGPLPERVGPLAGRLLFVGRSAFPDRAGFFAGARVPENLLAEARDLLAAGERPDFAWWAGRLGIAALWPGNEARRAGLGADESGRFWRALCLGRAPGLTVIGDDGWRDLLPGADLRPPVDYYGGLAAAYREAACCLNVTNLILPSGLTQRHFDVWGTGGFLLSDANPGLDIFPADLTRSVTFHRAEDIPGLFKRFASDSPEKRDLARAWREELAARHTYARRVAQVLASTGLERPRPKPEIGT
ncbi:glycosyltransferase family protein [Desulfovibrio sp.]